ncbi:MAG: amino acid permease, partial [Myxococcota bacterium]
MSPLRRSITLVPLTLYGLGTILGAGIYVLVGKVSGHAGLLAPAAFALSALLAGLTGLSFAELSARFPRSAGEAVYVSEAFGSPRLSTGVGLAIALSGVASAATMCVGVSGYVSLLIDVPSWLTIVVLLGVLGGLTAWGLQASVTVAAAMT